MGPEKDAVGDGKRSAAMTGVLSGIVEMVNRVGWAVMGIVGTPAEPAAPFSYTVGASAWTGGTEFLVAGVPPTIGQELLNTMVARARDTGWRPRNDELVFEVVDGYACKLATMGEDHECNVTRQLVIDAPWTVMQLLLPDRDGRLPDDPECSPAIVLMQVVPGSTLLPLT
jgi:hypothetical protein